jgi:hypothetical protein
MGYWFTLALKYVSLVFLFFLEKIKLFMPCLEDRTERFKDCAKWASSTRV